MNDQSPSKSELELQKLDLEVQVLKARAGLEQEKARLDVENQRHTFRRTLMIAVLSASVPMTIAVIGWTIQTIQARRAASLTEQYRREERYNKMIENLGNPSPSVRLAAVSGLSEYALSSGRIGERETSAEVINALTNRLGVEDDAGLQQQILITIGSVGKSALPHIANANRYAAAQFIQHSGKLTGLLSMKRSPADFEDSNVRKKIIADDLPQELASISLGLELTSKEQVEKKTEPWSTQERSSGGGYLEELFLLSHLHSVAFEANISLAQSINPDQIDAAISTAQADFRRSARFLLATNSAMEQVLRGASGNLRGENLDGIVIIWANLRKLDLTGVSFRNTFLRADTSDSYLNFCDLSRSVLVDLRVTGAKFRGATLTLARIPRTLGLLEGEYFPDLTGANWWEAYGIGEDGQLERRDEKPDDKLEKLFPQAVQKEERKKLLAEWDNKK